MEDKGDNKRYYPQQAELDILGRNIVKYFALGERSQERSQFAASISEQLQRYSSHWTKRAVRLWFNNNKKNFLPNVDESPKGEPQGNGSLYSPQSSSKNQSPLLTPKQIPSMIFPPQPTNPIPMNPPTQIPMNPPNQMPMNPPNQMQMNPPSQIPMNPPTQIPMNVSTHLPMNPPNQMPMNISTQMPMNPPGTLPSPTTQNRPSSVHFSNTFTVNQTNNLPQMHLQMPPVQKHVKTLWENDPCQVDRESREYLMKLIELVKQAKANERDIMAIAAQYENVCQEMHEHNIKHPLELAKRSVNFPSKKKNITYFTDGPPRPPSVDPHGAMWQKRKFEHDIIDSYDCVFNDIEATMLVKSQADGSQRLLNYIKDGEWKTQPLGTPNKIESCCGNEDYCFALGSSSVVVSNLKRGTTTKEVMLKNDIYGESSISMASRSTAVAGFTNSSYLYYIKENGSPQIINPIDAAPDRFVCALNCLDNDIRSGIVVAYSQTPVLSVYASDGSLIRKLIGHTEPTAYMKTVRNIILTASYDKTAKLWDVRMCDPIISFTADKKAINGCSLTANHAILCLYDNNVVSYDIRAKNPCIGVSTDDYAPESPYYNEENDTLTLFGVASKDGIDDSLLFLNENFENTKYVFRRYHPFMERTF